MGWGIACEAYMGFTSGATDLGLSGADGFEVC
jgi:hypothetical protein